MQQKLGRQVCCITHCLDAAKACRNNMYLETGKACSPMCLVRCAVCEAPQLLPGIREQCHIVFTGSLLEETPCQ